MTGTRNWQERTVKKKAQVTGGAATFSSQPLLKQECEDGAKQHCRAGRPSRRRRSAEATTERRSISEVPIGTALVGANVLLREGLARILTAAGFHIVASTSCADDHLFSALPQEQSILLIIDVSDDFDAGLRQIERFKQKHPAGRVVVLADQHQPTKMMSAFRVGASAYLVEVATCETFVKSLELVMLGGTFLPPEILKFISGRQARSRKDRVDRHADDDDDAEIAGSDDPFIPAKDGASPGLEKLPVELFSNPGIAQVVSEGHQNNSTSLPTINTLRLVQKSD
jgi:DNA-binding NarL/FixJ family response regulator